MIQLPAMLRIPLKIESVQNLSEGWRKRSRRVKSERMTVDAYLTLTRAQRPALPCCVVLTRIAPRPLDEHDNLRHGFKPAVDAIAAWMGIKDNDERVTWAYEQARGGVREYAVLVQFQLDLFQEAPACARSGG